MNGQKFGLSEHAQGQLHLAGQLILQPFELDWDNGSSVLTGVAREKWTTS